MNEKFDKVIRTGYRVTCNPAELDVENGITPEIRSQIDKTLKKLLKGVKKLNIEIELLIAKYPQIPQFKNYLSKYYSSKGEYEKAFKINSQIVKEHPDYLFGKINLAYHYLDINQFNKIPEILGGAMEIKSLYPERDIFHIEEVMSYYQLAVLYFIKTENIEAAESRNKIMADLDNDHMKTTETAKAIALYNLKIEYEKFKLKVVIPESTKLISKRKYKQVKSEPVFINPEIESLYQYGFQIDFNVIGKLLSLPRESLIEDLKKVVADGISRYSYFKKETEWQFNTHSFVFHALFILSELKASEALNVVLDLLRQKEQLLDYWLSDSLTQDMWRIIFSLGYNQLDTLRDYMFEEGNFTYARTEVCQAVTQIALHFPERRKEVIQWYYNVFNYFLENKDNEGIIDTSLIGLMVSDLPNLKAPELEDTVVKLYQYGLAETDEAGLLAELLNDLRNKSYKADIRKLPAIEEVYEDLCKWERNFDTNSYAEMMEEKNTITYSDLPEIFKNTGRNEKCPCGSGLKFKKCHGIGS